MVHAEGAKLMAELWYVNWQPHKWEALGPEAPAMSPSASQNYTSFYMRYEMRHADIERVVEAHAVAARNLKAAGYDGIELHVSHGSLIEYFLSPYFNKREDQYGGGLANRARFLIQILKTVREALGSDRALGIRLTADEMLPGGLGIEETKEIIGHVSPTGLLDFVDIDISVEPEQAYLMTTSFFEPKLHNAGRIAALTPSIRPLVAMGTPGRVTSLSEAERLLANGATDMIGLVRGLIAEPYLVNNSREGHAHQNRICIAANHCSGGTNLPGGPSFGCAINPSAGREERWGNSKNERAPRSTRVVVVGGGPAGLEAARVAAMRGHQVTLLERSGRIGGGLALWADIPGREHLKTFPSWMEGQLSEAGVELKLGTEGTLDSVLGLHPEVVIVATGSTYDRTGQSGFAPRPVPGWDRDFVHPPEPVIRGEMKLAGRVVVLDEEGMHAAAGVCEVAAAGGASVELVTRWPTIAHTLGAQSRYIAPRLHAAGVTLSTGSYLDGIGERTATIRHLLSGQRREVEVDAVVLATMRLPAGRLADDLEGKVPYVYLIGDGLAPRTLREATYEGHRFARVIGEPGMPRSVTEELFRPLNTLRPAAFA
jgi:2,4-dienoyl-CoA reductase-like NADH-dependent reductase (Old Yellow Enzyme family)/thioredoxin reductase